MSEFWSFENIIVIFLVVLGIYGVCNIVRELIQIWQHTYAYSLYHIHTVQPVHYTATIRTKDGKTYEEPIEVDINTYAMGLSKMGADIRIIRKRTTYDLQKILWSFQGNTSFAKEVKPEGYSTPRLVLDKETKVKSSKGETYYVKLSKESVYMSPKETEEDVRRRTANRVQRIVEDKIKMLSKDATCQYNYLADTISEYKEHVYLRFADELDTKTPPAPKSAEQVRRIVSEYKGIAKKYQRLKAKLEVYENIFPELSEYKDLTLEDIKKIQREKKNLKQK